MSTHSNLQKNLPEHRDDQHIEFLTFGQLKVMVALILIALGVVFFLGQSNILDYGSSWWVIFIAIPGAELLWAAYRTYNRVGAVSHMVVAQFVAGAVAVILSLIFIFDPTWSFTRGWDFWRNIPLIKDVQWDKVWPLALVIPGLVILYNAWTRQSIGSALVGGLLIALGAIFILNISWNMVWPLAIVAVGAGLLFSNRETTD